MKGARFVQVGAYDGGPSELTICDMHMEELVKVHGWTGLLIEPQPEAFRRLSERYKGVPHVKLLNVAIGRPGFQTMYRIRHDPKLPDWCDQVATFRKEILMSHAKYGIHEGMIEKIQVRATRLRILLEYHKFTDFDILLSDAEGYDLNVIMDLSQSEIRPKYILYEHKHLTSAEYDLSRDFLESMGYKTVVMVSPYDTIALRYDVSMTQSGVVPWDGLTASTPSSSSSPTAETPSKTLGSTSGSTECP